MLQKLAIQNYAIISELTIEFKRGLNIITGETGAGKSIIIGALNLVLGARGDSSMLQNAQVKSVIEAGFKVPANAALTTFLTESDLDISDELILRREIAVNGKSRSFINDTPVNLSALKRIGSLLVDLHQQFDTLELGNENFQREVLDALAGNETMLKTYQVDFKEYRNNKKELESLEAVEASANKERDYNQFLFDELEALSLEENEFEVLESELKLLENAENIKGQLGAIYASLKDGDDPLVQHIRVFQQKLSALIPFNAAFASLSERMSAAFIELKDIAEELEHLDENIHFDDKRIRVVNDRLSVGYKLMKKHSVNDTAGLIALQKELSGKLENINNISASIGRLKAESDRLYKACVGSAEKISEKRVLAIDPFLAELHNLLKSIGMPNARMKVALKPSGLSYEGADEVFFLFDANSAGRYEPLHKVASGGELSRLMLSIKSLVASKLAMPTLIFDEIDSGISGEAAKQVGQILKSLAEAHQLIVISHQPQIAAKANTHFFVYKEKVEDKILTNVRILNKDERVNTIAEMLAGEKPTSTAIKNAREMIGS